MSSRLLTNRSGIPVVVVVEPGAALGEPRRVAFHAGLGGDVLERAVALVAKQAVVLPLAGDEEVDPAVVVEVGPGGGVGIDGVEQAGFLGHVDEAAATVVSQQCGTHGPVVATLRGE